jgi:hypothetical protein
MLTRIILRAASGSRKDGDDRRKVIDAVQVFIRMYCPHAARETTWQTFRDKKSPWPSLTAQAGALRSIPCA